MHDSDQSKLERQLYAVAGVFVCGLLLGGVIASRCSGISSPEPSRNRAVSAVEVKVDTVVTYVPSQPIYVRGPGRVRIDTVVRPTEAVPCPELRYTATLDTVVNRDTLSVSYEHPSTTFSVLLRSAPDSVKTVYQTVTVTQLERERRSWIMDVLTHTGAAAIGYVAASAR